MEKKNHLGDHSGQNHKPNSFFSSLLFCKKILFKTCLFLVNMVMSLVELKREEKWHSKLGHNSRKVLNLCLQVFSGVFSFRKKQVTSPRCSETTLALVTSEDILIEILQHLPVKSLVRFKSVSKAWRSVIDSRHLQLKHLQIGHKRHGDSEKSIVFELDKSGGFQFKTLSKDKKFCSPRRCYCRKRAEKTTVIKVAGSCNGLVCVYDSDYIYIVNPATRRIRRLDPPPPAPAERERLYVGFGRDIVTGTYKVVVVVDEFEYGPFSDDDELKVLVFDLGTNEWRRRYETAGQFPSCPISFYSSGSYQKPLFVNGSLVWTFRSFSKETLVMDLHTEKLRKINNPYGQTMVRVHIWNLNDRLCASKLSKGLDSDAWFLVQDEPIDRWERVVHSQFYVPPVLMNSTWFTETLISP